MADQTLFMPSKLPATIEPPKSSAGTGPNQKYRRNLR
jgi:hypothetical protein